MSTDPYVEVWNETYTALLSALKKHYPHHAHKARELTNLVVERLRTSDRSTQTVARHGHNDALFAERNWRGGCSYVYRTGGACGGYGNAHTIEGEVYTDLCLRHAKLMHRRRKL